jgi:hypothetical protein
VRKEKMEGGKRKMSQELDDLKVALEKEQVLTRLWKECCISPPTPTPEQRSIGLKVIKGGKGEW